jgi:hypothetical protein
LQTWSFESSTDLDESDIDQLTGIVARTIPDRNPIANDFAYGDPREVCDSVTVRTQFFLLWLQKHHARCFAHMQACISLIDRVLLWKGTICSLMASNVLGRFLQKREIGRRGVFRRSFGCQLQEFDAW